MMVSPNEAVAERLKQVEDEEKAFRDRLTSFRKNYFMNNSALAKSLRDYDLNFIERFYRGSSHSDGMEHFVVVFRKQLHLASYALALMQKAKEEIGTKSSYSRSLAVFKKQLDSWESNYRAGLIWLDELGEFGDRTKRFSSLFNLELQSLRHRLLLLQPSIVEIYMEGFKGTLVMTGRVEAVEEVTPELFEGAEIIAELRE